MYKNLKLVQIDYKYCDYLRKYDNRVIYNAGKKKLRPFVGILFKINDYEYFAPLSSPKQKHIKMKNTIDIIKIKNGEYGVVNFNNMIPVMKNNYYIFDLNKKSDDVIETRRINLLNNQLRYLNLQKNEIYQKSRLLYNLYKDNKLPDNVKNRCCNFMILENKCNEYNC